VFAYGATGSGKTHTMVGHGGETGIMVRAISDLFDIVNKNAYRYTVSGNNNEHDHLLSTVKYRNALINTRSHAVLFLKISISTYHYTYFVYYYNIIIIDYILL